MSSQVREKQRETRTTKNKWRAGPDNVETKLWKAKIFELFYLISTKPVIDTKLGKERNRTESEIKSKRIG